MLCVCCTTTCTQNPQQIGVRAKPPTNGQTVYSRGQWARERERGDTTDRADGDGGVNGAIASPIYNSQSHGHIQRQKASPARSVRQLSDGICYSKTTLASSDAPTHVRQKEKNYIVCLLVGPVSTEALRFRVLGVGRQKGQQALSQAAPVAGLKKPVF